MSKGILSALSVSQVNKQLPILRSELQSLNRHLRFLTEEGKAGRQDARDLMRALDSAKLNTLRLDQDLRKLLHAAKSVQRRQLGDTYGLFRSNVRGMLKNIDRDFEKLIVQIEALDNVAMEKMNDPGRSGEDGAEELVKEMTKVLGLLLNLIELWKLERSKTR